MATCEICGIQIIEKVDRVYVEGNLLTVCKSCSKRGKPSSNSQNIQKTGRPSSSQQNIQKLSPLRPKKIVKTEKITFDDTRMLVSDLSEVIRKSRMTKGLTHEQLGLSLNERASLLRKIESGSIKPDEELTKKLERFFRISLYTEVDSSG
ncbi:MAG TPA: multiprotein bridging factor aMBF1 [Nitrososphaeraceae archaeon]|nr:multiprotein bridging factor aMBF1 [Nitrososphaeraceae archaeon]